MLMLPSAVGATVGVSGFGEGVADGVRVAVGVGSGVGVCVARLSGVTDASANIIAVGVTVVNLATRRVGSGVGVDGSAAISLKRQAITVMANTKKKAKNLRFVRFKIPNPMWLLRCESLIQSPAA